MTTPDPGELLRRSAFFGAALRGADAAALEALLGRFRRIRFGAGQQIFSRGETGDALYLIVEGRVRVSVVAEDGRELSFRHATAGEVFGEIAMLDGGPRTADAVALSATEALALRREDFQAIAAGGPELFMAVIGLLCARLRETSGQLEAIALHTVEARLARFLLLALRGQRASEGKRVPLELGFSQSELAQLLGASRPKVNTALRQLEEAGALRRTADRLFVAPDRLAAIAGQADDV